MKTPAQNSFRRLTDWFEPAGLTRRQFLNRSLSTAALIGGASLMPKLMGAAAAPGVPDAKGTLTRLPCNHPGLITDLGVGLWGWPIPCDHKGNGRPDLIVICGAGYYRGTYFFENTGRRDPQTGMEIFRPAVRIGDGRNDLTPSYTPEGLRVLGPGWEYPDFLHQGLAKRVRLPVRPQEIYGTSRAVARPSWIKVPGETKAKTVTRIRGEQWSYVDFDGDGRLDLVVGYGDWTDYGWDNAYDQWGRWVNGPLHGYVYVLKNEGTNERPVYGAPLCLEAGGKPVDVYGTPSPVFGDFRGAGKLDLICGEFIDGLTFFENTGTRTRPEYARGRRLRVNGRPLTMPLCMIVVVAYDWNGDGKPDLIVAQEDGRVALIENTGRIVDGMPEFLPPRFFRQEADSVKVGSLSAPVSFDWTGSGREDLVVGNDAGEIALVKNLGGSPPRWAEPVGLEAGGKPIRIRAGCDGSIQGPAEEKWGYANISVADWDLDGLPDILASSSWGRVVWFRNIGTRAAPRFAAAQPVEVEWNGPAPKPAWNWWDPQGKELATQWRCTPCVIDLNGDGLPDLVTLDPEGYLAFYERKRTADGRLVLLPPRRAFWGEGVSAYDMSGRPLNHESGLLRLNTGEAGASGRRTFCFVDWDGDGVLDLIVNSIPNVNFLKGLGKDALGRWVFRDLGPLASEKLAGHSTTPTVVHWRADGVPDLLIGAEDGFIYHLRNPRLT